MKFMRSMCKIGNGLSLIIEIGNGGGGAQINGGITIHANNAINYGINMRKKLMLFSLTEFI